MKALGLDTNLLREFPARKRMAHDAAPNAQFRREQFNEDDQDTEHESSNPEVAALADFLREEGFPADLIERACAAAMVNKYSAMDDADPLTKLRDYLRDKGLSEDDISEACEVARRDTFRAPEP